MLRRLLIRDFVIVDHMELDFQAGFGALTGETGAGKSILIDALSLALGERADAGVVRAGRDKAEVCAEFDVIPGSPLAGWLEENDCDDGSGHCLLRRVVDGSGKSRAYLNGSPTTLAQLKAAADHLADIHGQHAHQSLLRSDAQRHLLDGHAGLTALAKDVAQAWRAWQQAREAREQAELDAEAGSRERELLEWQVKELKDLAFDAEQWQQENQEHGRLAHAASLMAGAEAAVEALDTGEVSALSLLDPVLARLGELADVDVAMKPPLELLESARIQIAEAAHELSRYRQRLDLEPDRLESLEARIAAVTDVARKHRVSVEALPALTQQLSERLDSLRLFADPAALAAREAAAHAHYLALARPLGQGRAEAAHRLSEQVTAAMQELAMAGGRFEIALVPWVEGSACGLETVEFRVAANAGQPLRPLAKVASGGELSRIGLAIQVIASQSGEVSTLIFDEVDVGIGGGVAEIVGRLLRQLGQDRQVLCVTHLPQVAAQAHWQWSIAKESRAGETLSQVSRLDDEGRVEEIARMLGGVKMTETTRKHAREMLGFC